MTGYLSPIEQLRDPALRARTEQYIAFLEKRGCQKSKLWVQYYRALLDNQEEHASRIWDEIYASGDKTPIEERLKDPEYRAGAERYVALEWQINPTDAAFWQTMLDGETEKAWNILRQKDLFAINRMLSETPEDDAMGQKALSGWKQSLLQKIRE